MIARLTGTLVQKSPPELVLDVNGVGYLVSAPMSSVFQLPALGERVMLHTHMVVREDAQLLFGFVTESERSLFQTLIKISGVGPKVALGVLSGMSAEALAQAVQGGDAAALSRLPGIGKKTAERLIVELKDKLDASPGTVGNAAAPDGGDLIGDACAALEALGYKASDALRMAKSVQGAGSVEEIIRQALQNSVRR
ncbi:MAG: Holliday junction branch migration protein RuvA [Pseudomonadota bacterium]